GRLRVADKTPTGSPMLDLLLADIAAEIEQLHPSVWIKRLMPRATQMRSDALETLCSRGILSQEEHLYLWVLEERRYPVEHGAERMECKRRIVELLFNDETPDHHDAALVALADASGMFRHILSHKTLAEVSDRVVQL